MKKLSGEERGENELVHWCHGGAGAIYTCMVAYMVLGDKKYLNVSFYLSSLIPNLFQFQAAHGCCEVIWEKGILQKGPGICHGVAGTAFHPWLLTILYSEF